MKEITSGVSIEPLPSEIRFLAVDDEPQMSDLVEHLLIARGLPGEACTDGRQALSILEQSKFQVVVCDLNMPGIGGMDLLEEVRTRYPEVAFVMMTGANDVREGIKAIKAGASDYLPKPLQGACWWLASFVRWEPSDSNAGWKIVVIDSKSLSPFGASSWNGRVNVSRQPAMRPCKYWDLRWICATAKPPGTVSASPGTRSSWPKRWGALAPN
jgi:CheY-like chemotaxis protein